MNNHSDDRELREKWERWTRTPVDVIRNDRTGVTHLAVSHQDYTRVRPYLAPLNPFRIDSLQPVTVNCGDSFAINFARHSGGGAFGQRAKARAGKETTFP